MTSTTGKVVGMTQCLRQLYGMVKYNHVIGRVVWDRIDDPDQGPGTVMVQNTSDELFRQAGEVADFCAEQLGIGIKKLRWFVGCLRSFVKGEDDPSFVAVHRGRRRAPGGHRLRLGGRRVGSNASLGCGVAFDLNEIPFGCYSTRGGDKWQITRRIVGCGLEKEHHFVCRVTGDLGDEDPYWAYAPDLHNFTAATTWTCPILSVGIMARDFMQVTHLDLPLFPGSEEVISLTPSAHIGDQYFEAYSVYERMFNRLAQEEDIWWPEEGGLNGRN